MLAFLSRMGVGSMCILRLWQCVTTETQVKVTEMYRLLTSTPMQCEAQATETADFRVHGPIEKECDKLTAFFLLFLSSCYTIENTHSAKSLHRRNIMDLCSKGFGTLDTSSFWVEQREGPSNCANGCDGVFLSPRVERGETHKK